MTIKRWAQDAAKAAVWGSNPEVLIEFSTTEAGTIPPKELYEMAYQMAFDTEAKERVAMLQNKISAGIPLKNEDDKAFYEKYRHKYGSVQKEQEDDSFAYWESEMTEIEALEKFKGGKGNDKKKQNVYCEMPRCNHRVFDADYADVEIKCPECRKVFEVK